MSTIPTIQFLRNNNIYSSRDAARSALEGQKGNVPDGGVILARYSGTTGEQMIIKTLAGFVSNISTPQNATVTIIDVEGAINNISGETAVEEGKFISAITQTNGVVTARLGGVAAANVSVADEGNIFTATTVEGVLSEIQNSIGTGGSVGTQITNAINALDSEKSGSSTSNHITVGVKQVDGKITSVTVSDSDIASATLLGTSGDTSGETTAFGYIAKEVADRTAAIQALDLGQVGGTGQVITTISQADGQVSATAIDLTASNVQATPFISSDTTVAVTGTKVSEQIASLATSIKSVASDAKSYSIEKISSGSTELSANVLEAYKLVDEDGKQSGATINIYKDSSLKSVALVDQKLNFTYILTDGTESTVEVDVSKFLAESEFSDGLEVANHVVKVKIAEGSEDFLTVDTNGIKLSGVQDAINAASGHVNTIIDGRLGAGVTSSSTATAQFAALSGQIASINATIDSLDATVSDESTHVDVTVVQEDGIITSVTVANKDIASASALTAETTARTNADTELSNRLGIGITTAATATAQLQALSGKTGDASGVTSVNGAKAYATDLVNSLDATVFSSSGTSTTKAIEIVQTDGKLVSITLGAFDCGTY